jgi:hypothetical protein
MKFGTESGLILGACAGLVVFGFKRLEVAVRAPDRAGVECRSRLRC